MEAVRRVVQRLADARLVTTSLDKGEESVQIIHDSLIREWARLAALAEEGPSLPLLAERAGEGCAGVAGDFAWRGLREGRGPTAAGTQAGGGGEVAKGAGEGSGRAGAGVRRGQPGIEGKEREKEERARAEKERTRRRIIQGVAIFSIFSLTLAGLAYDKMLVHHNINFKNDA